MVTGHILEKLAATAAAPVRDPSRCLRMRFSESSCDRCRAVCPAGAISLENGLAVDDGRCAGCLSCTSACPSGALEAGADFDRLLGNLAGRSAATFVLGCERQGGGAHHRIPCHGMLSVEHLAVLALRGDGAIQVDISPCSACPSSAMREGLARRLELLHGLPLPGVGRIVLVDDPARIDFGPETLDRRGFFNSFRRLALQGIASVISGAEEQRSPLTYLDKSLPARRRLVNSAAESLPPELARSLTRTFDRQVTFSGACSGCMGCVRACPTAALAEPEGTSQPEQRPTFDARRCTGCGLCMEFCLDGAIMNRLSLENGCMIDKAGGSVSPR
ncbi:MAG: 4Fe-4S binding protein [Geobacteraceae bacterium]|nr:4Fe-4S binding protein [Geobacteraceae bacterium]